MPLPKALLKQHFQPVPANYLFPIFYMQVVEKPDICVEHLIAQFFYLGEGGPSPLGIRMMGYLWRGAQGQMSPSRGDWLWKSSG